MNNSSKNLLTPAKSKVVRDYFNINSFDNNSYKFDLFLNCYKCDWSNKVTTKLNYERIYTLDYLLIALDDSNNPIILAFDIDGNEYDFSEHIGYLYIDNQLINDELIKRNCLQSNYINGMTLLEFTAWVSDIKNIDHTSIRKNIEKYYSEFEDSKSVR